MIIRKSHLNDVQAIVHIIDEAKAYFKAQGIDQWQQGYPYDETIVADIQQDKSYVLEVEGEIIATAVVSFNDEVTYNKIYEGQWLSEESYGVIHRIAVTDDYKGQGIAKQMFEQLISMCCEAGAKSIKIDTHRDNQAMRRLLGKLGFIQCGIIYLLDGNERIAFERMI